MAVGSMTATARRSRDVAVLQTSKLSETGVLLVVELNDRRAAALYSRSSSKQNNSWGDLAKIGAEQVGVRLLRLLQPESYLRENG